MINLISLNDRQELVCSNDPAVVMDEADRMPIRFLEFQEAEINGQKPSIFKIRPLNSRESMSLSFESESAQTHAIVKACELALVSVTGLSTPAGAAVTPEAIAKFIDAMYPEELAALGSHIITQSMKRPDPLEAAV